VLSDLIPDPVLPERAGSPPLARHLRRRRPARPWRRL